MDITDELRTQGLSLDAIRIDRISETNGITLDLLRLDLIDPLISGNKFFKLVYNLREARRQQASAILSFGGPYSNHLVALAAVKGFHTIGLVRGREGSFVLSECRRVGMEIELLTRAQYARYRDPGSWPELREQFPEAYILAEGGDNDLGRAGAALIAELIPEGYDLITLSVGSGTTFAGLRNALPPSLRMLGFAPMKEGRYLEAPIRSHLDADHQENWSLTDEFHFGGFGKVDAGLVGFGSRFLKDTGILLDSVYTAKMMGGLSLMIRDGDFPAGSRILALHTGGTFAGGQLFFR